MSLSLDQRAQCFLRLSDGGLGFGFARQATEAAFLGSWALALQEVAESLGVNTWEVFALAVSRLLRPSPLLNLSSSTMLVATFSRWTG